MEVLKCDRPTAPGLYICQRMLFQSHPVLAPIRVLEGELHYFGNGSGLPLNKVEDSALWWGPLTLEV